MPGRSIIASLTLALALAACGDGREVRLPGERLDIRAGLDGSGPAQETVPATVPALSLVAPQANADWTHRLGSASHQIRHPALGPALTRVFSVPIGEGDSRRDRITADPVVAGGRVFTLDARSRVTAVSTGGEVLWTRTLVPASDSRTDATGGGLAVSGDTLFVTTGFGELSALSVATGDLLWTQDLDAGGGSAPTVRGDLVYVVARDSRAWAVDAASGRIRWTLTGTPAVQGFSGGAGAAVTGDIAVFPFASGEVIAAFPLGGLRRWSTVLAGARTGRAAATLSDISGDPVIDGGVVYVGNVSGRVAALDLASGDRLWTATEGAVSPVWPAGNSIFLVNDLGDLLRLDARSGAVLWRQPLPGFVEQRERRQKTSHAHYGPVLAGGRLIVASSDGLLRQFDPRTGALLGAVEIPGGATTNPAVAGGTLYVVTGRGQLVAYR